MAAAVSREAYLIKERARKQILQGKKPSPSSTSPKTTTNPPPATKRTALSSLARPVFPKDATDPDLVKVMTAPFETTKDNPNLRKKMAAAGICFICRWRRSHASGCPSEVVMARATEQVEEVKESGPLGFGKGEL